MIVLTNLQGEQLAINDGLIERVEGDHDTRVTLTSGAHYIVKEPVDEIVRLCREDRASVMALSRRLDFRANPSPPEEEDDDEDGAELHLLRAGPGAPPPARRASDRGSGAAGSEPRTIDGRPARRSTDLPVGSGAGPDGRTSDDR